jgi:hypothetical protein
MGETEVMKVGHALLSIDEGSAEMDSHQRTKIFLVQKSMNFSHQHVGTHPPRHRP